MSKNYKIVLCLLLTIILNGCIPDDAGNYPTDYPYSKSYTMEDLLLAESPETSLLEEKDVQIDYSNASLGYIRIKRLNNDDVKMKVRMVNESITLPDYRDFDTNDLNKVNVYETFPIVYGSGHYKIIIFKYESKSKKYKMILNPEFQVALLNEQSPFLYPNQTVDYTADSKVIQTAFALCKEDTTDLQRVKTIYEYVTNNITYDNDKAEAVKNTYVLPNLDETLRTEKGICFDYAALFAAMCRSQHIPCKVVVGNTEIAYHAWAEVWLEGSGWINPEILFEAKAWTRLDPTFAASKTHYDSYYETVYEY